MLMTSSTLTVTTMHKSMTFSCWGVIQSGHLTNCRHPSHFVMLHCVTRRRVTVSMNTKWRYTVLYNSSAVLWLWWCVKINRNSSLRPGRRPRIAALHTTMHTSWGKLENLEILQLCRECVAMIVQTAKTAYNVCTLPKHVLIHRMKIPKTVPVCHVTRLLPRCEHAGAAPLLHRDGHHHPHGEGKHGDMWLYHDK